MTGVAARIAVLRSALAAEMEALLGWWRQYAVDHVAGGFYGEVGNDNIPVSDAAKGLVLNARILWTFSDVFRYSGQRTDLDLATRAFHYFYDFFRDTKYGGFYWSLKADGQPLDRKKQVYGQAFAIYGLTAYFQATANVQALDMAKATFLLLEQHGYDREYGGYIEAFAEDWSATGNLRLSEKDQNTAKSMNTHLHVIEAYARLYRVWPDARLAAALKSLLVVFKQHILSADFHQRLFFTANWQSQSDEISYGHDIEAAWLLQECAEILGEPEAMAEFKRFAVAMAVAALAGVDSDGGMYYEYHPDTCLMVREKHWWPQAEAMVGFFNAWQQNMDARFLEQVFKTWAYINDQLKDRENGEWFWGILPDGQPMPEPKAGFWKCPYHHVRACLELIHRIDNEMEQAEHKP